MSRRFVLILLSVAMMHHAVPATAGTPRQLLKKLGTLIDTLSVRGVDPNYIVSPERPWQLILRGNVSQSDLKMKATGDLFGLSYTLEPRLKTQPSQYVGLWAGYRGYGLGYTVNVGGDKGGAFTAGITGGSYGFNLRLHFFESKDPDITVEAKDPVSGEDLEQDDSPLLAPIKVHTVIADGFYLFNGKHYSHAAAYDQSVIQIRSAGSLMAGASYYHGTINYASDKNADLIYMMKGLGRIKLWQASVGAGYAYNWVPAKGLLVSMMAMPMLTFVNRMKTYHYNTNVEELLGSQMAEEEDEDEEEWHKWWTENLKIEERDTEYHNSRMTVGIDARLSLTYNFGRYFVSACGKFNRFRYHYHDNQGRLNDWYVNTSLGIRL